MVFNSEPYFEEPETWGPFFWKVIDWVVLSMDNNNELSKDYVYLFFYSLQNVLPCPECREHYTEYFLKYNLKTVLHSKELTFQWIYRLKDEINKRKNIESGISFETYLNLLEKK